jgi:hypothetical protein
MMPELQVASPAFSLWQRVKSNYHYHDLVATDDEGIVIGLFYSPKGYIRRRTPGWVYYIYWLHLPSAPRITVPLIEETLEEDLILNESGLAVE